MADKSKYSKLADFGRELLGKKSLEDGLPLISSYAKEVTGAQRCSIFIYNKEADLLWTTLADGISKIEVDSKKGVVGETLREKKAIVVNDPYTHPTFLPDVDKNTGYLTQNLITAPIFNAQREIVGVLELINKADGFYEEDKKFVVFFAHYISGFVELVTRYAQE